MTEDQRRLHTLIGVHITVANGGKLLLTVLPKELHDGYGRLEPTSFQRGIFHLLCTEDEEQICQNIIYLREGTI